MPDAIDRFLPSEDVPDDKKMRASTRENSEYKWQAKDVVGALEMESEIGIDPTAPMKPHNTKLLREEKFGSAQALFEELGLRDSFIKAVEAFPVETCCCGIIPDTTATIKSLVPHLNKTWVHEANEKMEPNGFKVDCFLWFWHNISGQSETYVLLIRFHDLEEDMK
jgi:hypothetical protein